MERRNIVREKSYRFAVQIVLLCRSLQEKREFIVSRQLLKSGTSIGANIEESVYAQSTADFISKLSISLKEAQETEYWLRLLQDTAIISSEQAIPLRDLLKELIAMLIAILKTTKTNQRKHV